MLAENWKKVLLIIVIILSFVNVVKKIVQVAPYARQVDSVVTHEVFTEEEIEQIKKKQREKKILDPKRDTVKLELNEDGQYIPSTN